MKRPIGITISALLLGWLAMTGFVNGWVILSDLTNALPASNGYLATLYGVAALFAAIGLWCMKKWSLVATRCWMVTCILFLIVPEDTRIKMMQGGVAGMLGFFVFIIILFWLFDRYVKSKLSSAV